MDKAMSDQALQLIAENKCTQYSFLDLGNCGLKKIPPEIGELSWLESLSFVSRWWEWDGKRWEEKRSRNSGEGNTRLMVSARWQVFPACNFQECRCQGR